MCPVIPLPTGGYFYSIYLQTSTFIELKTPPQTRLMQLDREFRNLSL